MMERTDPKRTELRGRLFLAAQELFDKHGFDLVDKGYKRRPEKASDCTKFLQVISKYVEPMIKGNDD